ncbi:MAG TPA: oligosaccharide flippase family protein [Bacteroidota bacterium]|nr:oligosaccharide flippase family protein [Bacteroidota bacterium]
MFEYHADTDHRERRILPTAKHHLKINIIANIAGSGWSALIQLLFIPIYIRLLGIEAFGLIGFYLTMQVVLQILDFGLSPTINREMARYSVLPDSAGEARDLVRTLEVCYWSVSVVIGAAILILAPAIASQWIHAGMLPTATVQQALMLMGILAAFQWPLTFYQGGLLGLQRQPLVGGLEILFSTLTHGGAVLVLLFVSPTITAFFIWRIIVGILQISAFLFFLWRSLPAAVRPARFDARLLAKIWRFSAGMSGITLSSIILSQSDKVVLSKVLSLEYFGYYSLAYTVVNGLSKLSIPVFNAIFPRFTSLLTAGDDEGLKRSYHLSTQFMALIILPLAMMLMFFPKEIIVLWTHNPVTADRTARIISIMVIGTAINSLMYLPYSLQLASGMTKLGLIINSVFIVTLVPSMVVMSNLYGGEGAAIVWVVLNSVYMLGGVPLTHHYLLKGETLKWFMEDVGIPFVCLFAVVWTGRQIISAQLPAASMIAALAGLLAAASIASLCSSNRLRKLVVDFLEKRGLK